MPDQPPPLIDLAANVADGVVIDWPAVESDADQGTRELIQGLRLLEQVAEVHTSRATNQLRSPETPALVSWGQLRLIERIGHGAFGEVYRAWDPRLDRQVALKLLAPRGSLFAVTETLPGASIIDEGRLLARLRHPSVVTVHGADEIDGRVGIWMELVDGRTLDAEVRERGPLPSTEVAETGIHLADALAAVHRAGLIHRDVKAQNAMRDRTGRTVLMDFGTGVEFDENADTAALAGTPLYLAPEVIEGAPATPKSDVYGLGVLLFYLASGGFPVAGRTLREIRRAHARGERRLMSQVRPDVPGPLAAVIDRAIAPSALDRFADAGAMVDALRQIQIRRTRRRMAMAFVLSAIVVAVAAIGVWSWFGARDGARVPGMTWTELSSEFVRVANIRGPALDGRWAPCTSPRGSRNVALCDVIDRAVRVLRSPPDTSRGQPAGRSALSPDGGRLAHIWMDEPATKLESVNVVNVNGAGQIVLYRSTAGLAFEEWVAGGSAVLVREGTGTADHRVLMIPTNGGAPQELWKLTTEDSRASLSPDGRMLVIERVVSPSNADVIAIDLTTQREAWRYDRATNDMFPIWQPDGAGIVFVSDPDGCRQIMRLPVESGRPRGEATRLHEIGPQDPRLWGFGRDGSLYVGYSDRIRTALLSPIDLDRPSLGAPRTLRAACVDVTLGADWAPNGRRLAFVRGAATTDRQTTVVIANADGRVEREIEVPGIYVGQSEVRWSPDGRQLAVTYRVQGSGGILGLAETLTGEFREVARTTAASPDAWIRHPRWDPAGTGLFYRDRGVRRLNIATGASGIVYQPNPAGDPKVAVMPDLAGFDVAPDGSWLMGVQIRDTSDCIVRIIEPGGRQVDRHVFTNKNCHGMTWTRDGSKMLVATIGSTQALSAIWLLDRHAGEPVQIHEDTRPFLDFSLSPDARQLLFTAGPARPTSAVLGGIPGISR